MFTHSGQVKPILDLPSSTRTCKELVPNLIAGRGQMADPIRSTRLRRLLPRVGEHAQFGQIECLGEVISGFDGDRLLPYCREVRQSNWLNQP